MGNDIKYWFLAIGLLIAVGIGLKGRITHEQFDSDKWKNWIISENEFSLRWDMMNSLRKKHSLKGMTSNEIIELLGEPDAKSQNLFKYQLGYSKHGINIGILTINFNENNTVVGFSVWEG